MKTLAQLLEEGIKDKLFLEEGVAVYQAKELTVLPTGEIMLLMQHFNGTHPDSSIESNQVYDTLGNHLSDQEAPNGTKLPQY